MKGSNTLELEKKSKIVESWKCKNATPKLSVSDLRSYFVENMDDKTRGADKPAREDLKTIKQALTIEEKISKFEKKKKDEDRDKKKRSLAVKKTPMKKIKKTSFPRTPTSQKKMKKNVQDQRSPLMSEQRKDLELVEGGGGKMERDLRLMGKKNWKLLGYQKKNLATDKLADNKWVLESASPLSENCLKANLLGIKNNLQKRPNLLGIASGVRGGGDAMGAVIGGRQPAPASLANQGGGCGGATKPAWGWGTQNQQHGPQMA